MGEWGRNREEFKIAVDDISKLNLGFSGENVRKQWREQMGMHE